MKQPFIQAVHDLQDFGEVVVSKDLVAMIREYFREHHNGVFIEELENGKTKLTLMY